MLDVGSISSRLKFDLRCENHVTISLDSTRFVAAARKECDPSI